MLCLRTTQLSPQTVYFIQIGCSALSNTYVELHAHTYIVQDLRNT